MEAHSNRAVPYQSPASTRGTYPNGSSMPSLYDTSKIIDLTSDVEMSDTDDTDMNPVQASTRQDQVSSSRSESETSSSIQQSDTTPSEEHLKIQEDEEDVDEAWPTMPSHAHKALEDGEIYQESLPQDPNATVFVVQVDGETVLRTHEELEQGKKPYENFRKYRGILIPPSKSRRMLESEKHLHRSHAYASQGSPTVFFVSFGDEESASESQDSLFYVDTNGRQDSAPANDPFYVDSTPAHHNEEYVRLDKYGRVNTLPKRKLSTQGDFNYVAVEPKKAKRYYDKAEETKVDGTDLVFHDEPAMDLDQLRSAALSTKKKRTTSSDSEQLRAQLRSSLKKRKRSKKTLTAGAQRLVINVSKQDCGDNTSNQDKSEESKQEGEQESKHSKSQHTASPVSKSPNGSTGAKAKDKERLNADIEELRRKIAEREKQMRKKSDGSMEDMRESAPEEKQSQEKEKSDVSIENAREPTEREKQVQKSDVSVGNARQPADEWSRVGDVLMGYHTAFLKCEAALRQSTKEKKAMEDKMKRLEERVKRLEQALENRSATR